MSPIYNLQESVKKRLFEKEDADEKSVKRRFTK